MSPLTLSVSTPPRHVSSNASLMSIMLCMCGANDDISLVLSKCLKYSISSSLGMIGLSSVFANLITSKCLWYVRSLSFFFLDRSVPLMFSLTPGFKLLIASPYRNPVRCVGFTVPCSVSSTFRNCSLVFCRTYIGMLHTLQKHLVGMSRQSLKSCGY